MWAQTTTARTARRQIIEVFVAWRRGDLGARDVERAGPDAAFLRDGDRAEAALRHLRGVSGIDEFLRRSRICRSGPRSGVRRGGITSTFASS